MQKIKYYLEKYKIHLTIFIMLIFIILILAFVLIKKEENNNEIIQYNDNLINVEEIPQEAPKTIKVDIKGKVKKPGVYELNENSRVIDVINKAGGLKDNANTEYINLSKKIVDEMLIIIYSSEEVEKYKKQEKEIIYIEYKCDCPDNINDACITEKDIVNTNGITSSNESNSTHEKISINTATIEELMTLDGIGESKAKAIIEYREKNGEFKQLEEIMNVSGIGEAAYSKIKDNIKL